MDEEQLNRISKAVREFLGANRGLRMVRSAEVTSLVEYVRQRVTGVEEVPLHVASLMCALGPGRGAPPVSMLREVSEIVTREVGGDLERIKEVVIAYGCGKWRCLRVGTDPWDWSGQWNGAFQALVEALVTPVREVNVWLSKHLVGYDKSRGYWHSKEEVDEMRSDAGRLAVHLAQPVESLHLGESGDLMIVCEEDGVRVRIAGRDDWLPFGAKAVLEVRTTATLNVHRNGGVEERHALPAGALVNVLAVENWAKIRLPKPLPNVFLAIGETCSVSGSDTISRWNCACGNCNCATQHRLENWDLKEHDLWWFLANAVKGRHSAIKTKALVDGMYLPVLGKDGTGWGLRLRVAPVEYKLCSGNNCQDADPVRKFEGNRCSNCKHAFDPRTTLRRAYERWIVVGGDAPLYERAVRYRCTAKVERNSRIEICGNLYEHDKCPVCGSPPAMRKPTIVWVRTFNTSEPFDDDTSTLPISSEDDPWDAENSATGDAAVRRPSKPENASRSGKPGGKRCLRSKPGKPRGLGKRR